MSVSECKAKAPLVLPASRGRTFYTEKLKAWSVITTDRSPPRYLLRRRKCSMSRAALFRRLIYAISCFCRTSGHVAWLRQNPWCGRGLFPMYALGCINEWKKSDNRVPVCDSWMAVEEVATCDGGGWTLRRHTSRSLSRFFFVRLLGPSPAVD